MNGSTLHGLSVTILTAAVVSWAACGSDPAPPSTADESDGGGLDAGRGAPRPDAGGPDAGLVDAGPADGEVTDGGPTDGEPVGRWVDLAPLRQGPRQENAVVALESEIVVIGGFDENLSFGTDVEAYDPASNTWRDLAPLPVAAHHPNAVVYDGRIYLLGFLGPGFIDDGRCFVYAPNDNEWSALSDMPEGRARGSSVLGVVDDQIYVVGGLRGGVSVADFDRYDPAGDDWQPLPPLPRRMDHGMGKAIGRRIYVAGGRAGGLTAHSPRLDVFDVDDGMWTPGTAMPTSRAGGAAAVLADVLYVFGGEGNPANAATGLFDEVEAYDPTTNAWRTLAPMRPARHGTGAAAFDGRLYVPGGADVQAFGAVDDHQAFVP